MFIEMIGALLLSTQFIPAFGWKDGITKSFFHSISAFCNAGFDTLGNFSSLTGYYSNPVINMTIMLLIIFGGLGFTVIFDFTKNKKFKKLSLHSKLALLVTSILLVFGTLVMLFLEYSNPETIGQMSLFNKLQVSAFQAVSPRTAGFNTIDLAKLTDSSKFFMMLLMFVGGCAGSTAGGLKVSRVMLLFKSCTIEVKKMLRPRCVENVRLDGKPVDGQTVYNAMTYFTFYIIILLIAGLIVSLDGLDFTTNFTAALSCLSNVGPGLSLVGPTGSFAIFSPLSKIVLMICMLLGRLEIFPLLLLFVPFTWRWK